MEIRRSRLAPRVAVALSTVLLAVAMIVFVPQGQAQAVGHDVSEITSQATFHQFDDTDADNAQATGEASANVPKQAKAYKAKYGLLAKNGVLYPCNSKGKKLGKYWKSGSTVRTIFVAPNVKTVKKLYKGMGYYCSGNITPKVSKVKFLLNKKKASKVQVISADFMKGHKYLKQVINFKRTKVKSIGGYAFAGTRIKSLTMPKTLRSIGKFAFANTKKLTTLKNLEKTRLTTIGEDAFIRSAVKRISLPASVTRIDEEAFAEMRSLSSVANLDKTKVTTIRQYTFAGSSKLSSIALPASCKSIGEGAFYKCSNLSTLTLKRTSVVAGGRGMLLDTKISTIRVPASLVGPYQAATYWGDYAALIHS